MKLILVPIDKANHAIYGAIIFLVVLAFALYVLPAQPARVRELALLFVAVFGALKEARDAFANWRISGDPLIGPHGVEFFDFLATTLGGLACYVAASL